MPLSNFFSSLLGKKQEHGNNETYDQVPTDIPNFHLWTEDNKRNKLKIWKVFDVDKTNTKSISIDLLKVLIVDDDEFWRQKYKSSLIAEGANGDNIIEADDGKSGLAEACKVDFDVIFLDHYMETNGNILLNELARKINQGVITKAHFPTVFSISSDSKKMFEKYYHKTYPFLTYVDGFLNKSGFNEIEKISLGSGIVYDGLKKNGLEIN